ARASREIFAGEGAHGRTDRAPGSNRFLNRSRPSHHLSDRQTPNYETARRSPLATGRKIQSPRLPRFRLEKRQRPDFVATLGILRRSRRSAKILTHSLSFRAKSRNL